MNETFFTTADFVQAWSHVFGKNLRPFAISVDGSGPSRTMYGIQTFATLGRYSISLAPNGLYASPGWDGALEQSTLIGIMRQLKHFRTIRFTWNVRFDHLSLAEGLAALGLKFQRRSTHILTLEQGYKNIFAGYNSTSRNEVRSSHRRGVTVRPVKIREDISAYFQIHCQLFQQKGIDQIQYPVELFFELIQNHENVRLLVAEFEGKIIGGGVFFRDGCSVLYWHGATDRTYSNLFPSRAIIDAAIHWACENKVKFFNFGNSAGITSLENFKASWGACVEHNWSFEWTNYFWVILTSLKGKLSNA